VLKVFEKRMPMKIVGPTMGEITGYWRRLHAEQLYDLCCSVKIVRVN
jgi:hypothetical protein